MKIKIRRMIAMLLVFCIVSSVWCGTASAAAFPDVSSSAMARAYFDAINYVSDRGIMEGNEDGNFLPNTGTDRAMVVVTLFRLSGDTGTYNQASQFSDVPSYAYYYNAVGWAVANGITSGANATEFKPNRIVTWAEFFTFLYRYAGYKGLPQSAEESITGASDYSSVGSWARLPISWAYTYGMLLRSNPNAAIYPNANLARREQALFLARFRRNVEGVVQNKDRFSFRNSGSQMLSDKPKNANGNYVSSRYLISDNDYSLLRWCALNQANSENLLQILEDERMSDWSGSCYGFALAVVLDNYGKVNLSGNCAKKCDTLYDIPQPINTSDQKHRQTADTSSSPVIPFSDIESKINMYHLSQNIPLLKNFEGTIAPDQELRDLHSGQQHSGIAMFIYRFDQYNPNTGVSEEVGHALVVHGKPITTGSGFKVKAYDCRYMSDCWVEVNTRGSKWTGHVAGTGFSEGIKECRYRDDFEIFNEYLDFDGAGNSLSAVYVPTFTQSVSIEDEVVPLEGKTILQVIANEDFRISNETGQSFTLENGTPIGTMPVYGVDFIVDGMGPSPLVFLVDDSSSFTCTAIGENAEVQAFTVIGGEASGVAQAEKTDDSSWKSVTIDDVGEINTEVSAK